MLYNVVRATALLAAFSQPAAAFQAVPAAGRPVSVSRVLPVQLVETAGAADVSTTMVGVVEPTNVDEDCGCAEPEPQGVLMNDVQVTGRTLRDTVLADVNGQRMALKDVIGDEGKAVVVFLRHLG